MGRTLLRVGKVILTSVAVVGMVIASFYFAYLLLILIVLAVSLAISAWWYNREEKIDWYRYKDYE